MNEDKLIFQSGAELDQRTDEAKLKDIKFGEFGVDYNPVNWVEKPQGSIRAFPIYNQNGSGSCVAQTQAKEMGIMRWLKDKRYVHFSATDIYQRRQNYPNGGMQADDARAIAAQGVTLEVLMPSENMTDSQMDSMTKEAYMNDIGKVFAVAGGIVLPIKDIDAVASVIQTTGKGVMVWFYFQIDEWTTRPVILHPDLDNPANGLRHSVTAVDFTLVDGKKCLVINDSWGTSFGMAGSRIIDEDFFKARNWYAGYLMNFRFDSGIVKPQYAFMKSLSFGQTDPDIKALQDVLKYEVLFPTNVSSSGYYGALTADGVLKFRAKHGVSSATDPLGHSVGALTRQKLNQLYST